jgi:hypothetical protein
MGLECRVICASLGSKSIVSAMRPANPELQKSRGELWQQTKAAASSGCRGEIGNPL